MKAMTQAMTQAMVLGVAFAAVVLSLGAATSSSPAEAETRRWQPAPGTSWQWQLSTRPETLLDVDAYDLDGFDTSQATVDRIHANGGKAICYISAGSWENWRPDKGRFPRRVLGRDYYGWPGERWLDVRQLDALAPIMEARMDVCKEKGFDAVEPDNMDGYQNRTGVQDHLRPATPLRHVPCRGRPRERPRNRHEERPRTGRRPR